MSLKKTRNRLYRINPLCCYCGILTNNEERTGTTPQKPEHATIEHLTSRYENELRAQRGGKLAISCYGCNSSRNDKDNLNNRSKQRYRSEMGTKKLKPWVVLFLNFDYFDRF